VPISRRATLLMMTAATALSLGGASLAFGADGERFDVAKLMSPAGNVPDHVLGDPNAPVTLIEYASPTCPHCAAFSNDVFPVLKSTYVDTGKVKFILRPFLRNILDAVVFMLAEAAGPDNFHNVISTYFKTQNDWELSDKPKDAMLAVATQLGFTPESFDKALTNQDLFNGMEAMRDQALNDFKVEGTPTFYINGKQLTGEQSFEQLAAEIEPLLPESMRGAAPVTPSPNTTTTSGGETFTPVAPDSAAAATTTTTAPTTPTATTTTTTAAPATPAATTTTTTAAPVTPTTTTTTTTLAQ
jgi:protein-disulfide isomerase